MHRGNLCLMLIPLVFILSEVSRLGGAELPRGKQTWSGRRQEPPKHFQNDVITQRFLTKWEFVLTHESPAKYVMSICLGLLMLLHLFGSCLPHLLIIYSDIYSYLHQNLPVCVATVLGAGLALLGAAHHSPCQRENSLLNQIVQTQSPETTAASGTTSWGFHSRAVAAPGLGYIP